jgi:hypothetical protein
MSRRKSFAKLVLKDTSKGMVIDNLRTAIESLNALGISRNVALLTNYGQITMLSYRGQTDESPSWRGIHLPLAEGERFKTKLKKILEKIFFPFTINDPIYRDLVEITEAYPGSYLVTLLLFFLEDKDKQLPDRKLDIIEKALTASGEEGYPIAGKIFPK